MPDPATLRMFRTNGLVKITLFCGVIFYILYLEYIKLTVMPLGLASAFLLMFVGVSLVAEAMNSSKPGYRIKGPGKRRGGMPPEYYANK